MQHLDPERLAALADEPPTAEEGAHLAHCLACRRERDAYVALLDLARREGGAGVDVGVLAPPAAPLTAWEGIAAALRDEGLIADLPAADGTAARDRAWRAPAPVGWRRSILGPARAAAAALLLVAGVAGGRLSAGASLLPTAAPAADALADGAAGTFPESSAATVGASGAALGRPVADGRWEADEAAAPTGTALAGWETREPGGAELVLAADAPFANAAHAARVLARAQRDYQRAAAYLAEHDPSVAGDSRPQVLAARLAALDDVMPRVREALYDAPQDPVLNQVYLTAHDVRESTIRQLGRALPVGAQLSGY